MFRIIIIAILCLMPIMGQSETLNQTLSDIGQRLKSLVVDIQRLSSEADRLSAEAKKAREEKNWEYADEIRGKLNSMNVIVEDSPQGPKWKIED